MVSPEWAGTTVLPPVIMSEKMMAASDPHDAETSPCKRRDEVRAGDARNPAHAAMVTRCIPTTSNSCAGTLSTSRQSSIASRMRCVTSSSDRACVWHPGICGTDAT